MAQTYTLDEAADKLNLSVEEFKRRLRGEWSQVRAFRDGATLRFRANEIDELARSIGLGSAEDLPMAESSPLDLPAGAPDDSGDVPAAQPARKGDSGAPLKLDDSDEAFVLTPDAAKPPSSKKIKKDHDSDVKLEKADKRAAGADDEESILTDEFEMPAEGGGSGKLSGKSGKLSSAQLKSGDSGKMKQAEPTKPDSKIKAPDSGKGKAPPADDSSEFELTLDQADSDEFELSLAQDSSEEVALGEAPAPAPAGKSGQSGINLNRPADSGVSLEKKDDDEIDFELSLDAPGTGTSSKKSGKKVQADSDSEFELTLEEPSDLSGELAAPSGKEKKGDIFEATDFEIPALEDDSASEAVSLDDADTDLESSDFDLALDEADAAADDESESQVVALSEADARKGRAKKKKKKGDEDVDLDEMELEEGASASAALRGVRADEDEEYEVSEAVDEDEVRTVAAPANWGPWPAILMIPTALVMFFAVLMAYETLHSVWGYQQNTTASTPLVSWFADQAGLKPTQ